MAGATDSNPYQYDGSDTGKSGVEKDLSGSVVNDTISITGNWKNGVHADQNNVTLDKWSSITIDLNNENLKQGGVNGVLAQRIRLQH